MARNFFTADEQREIIHAIQAAEKKTSGEIKVHLEASFGSDVIERTIAVFKKLNMHETALRNGVLIYIAVKDRQFAIIGDVGINEKVPEDFWENIKEEMREDFAAGQFTAGLINAIESAGEALAAYFPRLDNDTNELSDELSFDDDEK